ncbi:small subunit ribosomal protein S1 [Chaetoceros tenuissimus]|uniref:Small subunit ribosomal protein S1 n=1 Tax=Chaetoceros tenuissimus TaxID=426638 RepID=A0AAD3CX75_9STRA|nr:small subunit ribosomal protein S1 [Chaetoceros tenuissimus]
MRSLFILISVLSILTVCQAFIPSPSKQITTSLSSNEDVVLFSDDDQETQNLQKNKRWKNLSPAVKARIIKEGQDRAIRNKKKREPSADKKRRLMMQYKTAMVENKRRSRVERPFPTNSPMRANLKDIEVGEMYNGTVISLTDFGAYVDIGTECDGLLHVSQITRDRFVDHPRQVLAPGDEVDVRVVNTSPKLKKMQLSMLPKEVLEEEDEDEEEFEERIALEDLAADDELWGEIKRVTAFGAYVELGCVAQGWLHFMDHPEFEYGKEPSDFMKVGDRIRCWVVNVEEDRERLRITATRPKDLPGPKREFRMRDDSYY